MNTATASLKTKVFSKPHYIIGEDFIVVTHNGKPHTVYNGDARFNNLKNVIISASWSQLETALSAAKTIEKYGFGKVKVFDDNVFYDGQPVHNSITNRIIEFLSKGYEFSHLVKFLDLLMLNPSKDAREMAFEYLERYKMPIDKDGYVLAMKAVCSDFLDKMTRTISNKVGAKIEMPRSQISQDRNCACGPGLHHGWCSFVKSYGSGNDIAVLTRFSPTDICRIPVNSGYQKIVVCKYEVLKNLGLCHKVTDFETNYADDTFYGKELKKDIIAEKKNKAIIEGGKVEPKFLGANRAYAIHKEGKEVLSGISYSDCHVIIIKPEDKKPRSVFREGFDWQIITEDKLSEIIPTNGIKVGSNRAYELHLQGADLQSLTFGVVKKADKKTRKFFRSYKDWYQV